MDKLNVKKRERPLPSRRSSKKDAMRLVYITGLIGIILSFFLDTMSQFFSLVFLALFLLYSHPAIRLKKRYVVKELVVASGYLLNMLVGGFAVASEFQPTFVFAGIFYFFFAVMGMPAFHDITDTMEDEIYGIRTMAIVLSWKRRVQMLILFILVVMTLTPLTYVNLGFNIVLPIVVVAMGFIVLRYLIPLSNTFEQALFLKARRISYVYFILIHITFVIATLSI
jgi:4-hydroxybenzoate polyprenyltransferase